MYVNRKVYIKKTEKGRGASSPSPPHTFKYFFPVSSVTTLRPRDGGGGGEGQKAEPKKIKRRTRQVVFVLNFFKGTEARDKLRFFELKSGPNRPRGRF
jgi:hypothetical protein